MRARRGYCIAACCIAAALGWMAAGVRADVVLLDEYWVPDLQINDVMVVETDTAELGDETQAKSGEVSVLLENNGGWPNVRFRDGAWVELRDIPPNDSEACIWYRTDAWEGIWRLELWVHTGDVETGPIKMMEAILDGGGEGRRLIADDEWHQARGVLLPADEFENAPPGVLPSFVWLVPVDGWDIPHRTYLDRVEINVVAGPLAGRPAPEPARRVRPTRGAEETGPGWVWWEGEDRVDDNFQPGGALDVHAAEQQDKLSNGGLLQSSNTDLAASWAVEVPEPAEYGLWMRGYLWQGGFRWRWDEQPWHDYVPPPLLHDTVWVRWGLPVNWHMLGEIALSAGEHTLRVEGLPDSRAFAFDCWALSAEPFLPRGTLRPGQDAGAGQMGSVVLLDEYWVPEIVQSEVFAAEVDVRETGDPREARSGEFSCRLENETGAPNVRFRGGGFLTPAALPVATLEGSLLYRTDAWDGVWALEVWLHDEAAGVPVKVLEGMLGGGGPGGSLIADDEWHEAVASLAPGEGYDQLARSALPAACFVWLRPLMGWDRPHRTFVDRIELRVTAGPMAGVAPPEPARHVRPDPGAQVTGNGWVWLEGEDALESDLPFDGGLFPYTAEQQARLSNGAWLQAPQIGGCTATWTLDVPEAGDYALWGRGDAVDAPFQWRVDRGPWQDLTADIEPVDVAMVVEPYMTAFWARLGRVKLAAGRHTLSIRFAPGGQMAAIDCWLLTREPFTPSGTAKPGKE